MFPARPPPHSALEIGKRTELQEFKIYAARNELYNAGISNYFNKKCNLMGKWNWFIKFCRVVDLWVAPYEAGIGPAAGSGRIAARNCEWNSDDSRWVSPNMCQCVNGMWYAENHIQCTHLFCEKLCKFPLLFIYLF